MEPNIVEPDDLNNINEITIVLGWMGSKESQLKHFKNIYLKRNDLLICGICPTNDLYNGKDYNYAMKIYDLLLKCYRKYDGLNSNNGEGLYWNCHALSNGGSFIYKRLNEIINSEQTNEQDKIKINNFLKKNAKLIVFDSTPAELSLNSGKNAFITSIGRSNKIMVFFLTTIFYFMIILVQLKEILTFNGNKRNDRCLNFRTALKNGYGKGFLYIYSKNDAVSNYNHIKKHVEDCRKNNPTNCLVEEFILNDSKHILHLRTDPKGYVNAINSLRDQLS